jgi:hypothetical protein
MARTRIAARPKPTAAHDRRRSEITQGVLRRELVTHAAAKAARSLVAAHDQPPSAPTLAQRALAAVIAFTDAEPGSPEQFDAIEEFWRIRDEEETNQ